MPDVQSEVDVDHLVRELLDAPLAENPDHLHANITVRHFDLLDFTDVVEALLDRVERYASHDDVPCYGPNACAVCYIPMVRAYLARLWPQSELKVQACASPHS